jgi:hypothetical protein
MKLSLFAFFFSSLDEDFPHHDRMFTFNTSWKWPQILA